MELAPTQSDRRMRLVPRSADLFSLPLILSSQVCPPVKGTADLTKLRLG
jgi:hypothetical protein